MSSFNSNLEKLFERSTPVYVLILLFAFALYGNTLFNGYALDDHLVTTAKHEQISKGVRAIPDIFTTHYVSWHNYNVDYRPLVKTTFALEYELFGEDPGVSHLINVLLYGLTCILLFGLLLRIFPKEPSWMLFMALLIFMSHPVHTEVVASLKGRDELLSFLFLILGFRAILNWVDNRKVLFLAIAGISFYLSLISKASSLPWMLIIGFVLFFKKKEKVSRLLVVLSLMIGAVLLHLGIVSYLFDDLIRSHIFIETPFFLSEESNVKWPSIIVTAGHYLRLLVAPFPLCSYYGYDQIPLANMSDWRVFISLAAYCGLIILSIRSFKKQTLITVGAMILLLDLAPFINLIYPYTGVLGERVLYGGTLGFGLMITGFFQLFSKKQKLAVPIIGILVLAGSYRTISRNFEWKDNLTLFTADANNCDRSAKLQELHGLYLRGEYVNNEVEDWKSLAHQSIHAYQRSIAIYDKWPIPHHRIGVIYHYDLGKLDSAKAYYQKAVELNPDFVIAEDDLIQCLRDLGDHQGLASLFQKTLQRNEADPELWNMLVAEYFLLGNLEKARAANDRFLGLFPQRHEAHIHLGNIVMANGDTAQALVHFDKALEIDPKNEAFRSYLNDLKRK